MSALEAPHVRAIEGKEIEGVVMQGRDTANGRYSNTLGNRTLLDGTEKALKTDDILFLASATKLLTTLAALQCCEKGLLSLDKDLAPIFPDMVRHGVLVAQDDPSKTPSTEPLRKPITLRHLVTHSSGLIYDFQNPALQQWKKANPVPKDAPDVRTAYATALAFQPGEGWGYGIGLDWAGALVEEVTGMKLDEYFRTHLLKPLDIPATDISFFPVKEGLGERMPDLNPKDQTGQGLSAAMGNSVNDGTLTGCFGGQGGYATSEAYIAVLQSILLDDGKLLKSESVTEMFKPQLEKGAKEALNATLASPLGALMTQNTRGTDRDYALGGLLADEEGGGLGKMTLTWGGGCNTIWFIDQAKQMCGFSSLQLGLPANMEKAMELKGVFKHNLKEQLSGKS